MGDTASKAPVLNDDGLPPTPLTLEGWSVLHQMFRIRWREWNAMAPESRQRVVDEAVSALKSMEDNSNGRSGLMSLLGHKGDLIAHPFPRLVRRPERGRAGAGATQAGAFPGAHHILPLGGGAGALQRLGASSTVPWTRRASPPNTPEWKRAGGGLSGSGAQDHGRPAPARHTGPALRLLLSHGQETGRGKELV